MDLLKGPRTRYTGGTSDDVPKMTPIFAPMPVGLNRHRVRYGDRGSIKEPKQQALINALRNTYRQRGVVRR